MKLISEGGLYALLYAAYTYASYRSPAERINEYLVANDIVPPNIRRDSQLSDIWRDYQQVLAELGLMYSTRVTGGLIQPTPCGLNFLDNVSSFKEILTSQVLLYQYPNGGKREYADVQIANGVLIRPAVLVWRVISLLKQRGDEPVLTSSEIRDYLMHCCKHEDANFCANAISDARKTGHGLPTNTLTNAGRNASDWITLLTNTLLFKPANQGNLKGIALSTYSFDHWLELNEVMTSLEADSTFWNPPFIDESIRREWYSFYGAMRLDISLPLEGENIGEVGNDLGVEESEVPYAVATGIVLKQFDSTRLNFNKENRLTQGKTIESSYDADMVTNQHRLHDSMVVYIANHCLAKGAVVLDDPKSLDLFVLYDSVEFLIEVKTITPHNYIKRLRYAIGQLLHYDFMLNERLPERRRVLAFPTLITNVQQFVPFVNEYLDMDILSLRPTTDGQVIYCNSTSDKSNALFAVS